ncbi:MAG: HD domain-containing protein [Lentisphaeria bacterium]|nr:HD domain-containing protein [Lentisphaeria bacterium]
MSLVSKAKEFASNAHAAVNQKRKYTHDPYIIHPAAVAKKVASVTSDQNLIAAAWLHDTVEDTNVTIEQIEDEFGKNIGLLVESLTDVSKPSDGNRKIRKEIDRLHTKQASPGAKTVKLADLIDNSKSILKYGDKFTDVFIHEMELLLEVLSEGDPSLFTEAQAIVRDYNQNKNE